jgi:flavin-binding protein dodecin
MSVARTTELSAESPKSFDAAIQEGLQRATKTLRGIQNVWVSDHEIALSNNEVKAYRVRMKVTFVLEDTADISS